LHQKFTDILFSYKEADFDNIEYCQNHVENRRCYIVAGLDCNWSSCWCYMHKI